MGSYRLPKIKKKKEQHHKKSIKILGFKQKPLDEESKVKPTSSISKIKNKKKSQQYCASQHFCPNDRGMQGCETFPALP